MVAQAISPGPDETKQTMSDKALPVMLKVRSSVLPANSSLFSPHSFSTYHYAFDSWHWVAVLILGFRPPSVEREIRSRDVDGFQRATSTMTSM
jgi:hypothetical protein